MAKQGRPRKITAISERRAELARLQAEIDALEQAEAARLGRLAVAAGLAELGVSDADLAAAFAAVAARFRDTAAAPKPATKPAAKAAPTTQPPPPPPPAGDNG